MVYNSKAGFTLIELIMVIAIVGVLATAGAFLMLNFIQNSMFIPNKMNMDMLAWDALNIMVDGDSLAKGLLFCKNITDAQNNQVTFISQDSQSIRYRLDTGTNRLYRSIAGGAEVLIPYYLPSSTTVSGKSGQLFTYYDANGTVTGTPANVRRIKISLIARTGSGNYSDWQGHSEQITSVAVKKFQ